MTAAAHQSSSHTTHAKCAHRHLPNSACGYIGNSDIYGLGIRLSIYIQFLAMLIAMAFVRSERHSQFVAFVLFLIATVIALFVIGFQGDCTYDSEIIILLNIVWGGTLCSLYICDTMEEEEKTKPVGEVEGIGYRGVSLCFIAGAFALWGFSLWFWVEEARRLHPSFELTPCGTSIFLFAKIDGDSLQRASIALAVFSGLFAALGTFWVLVGVVVVLGGPPLLVGWAIYNREKLNHQIAASLRREFKNAIRQLLRARGNRVTPAARKKQFDKRYTRAALYGLAILAWTIIAVELMLYWNNITEVYTLKTTGQFIPLVIGFENLITVLWKLSGSAVRQMFGAGEEISEEDDEANKGPRNKPEGLDADQNDSEIPHETVTLDQDPQNEAPPSFIDFLTALFKKLTCD